MINDLYEKIGTNIFLSLPEVWDIAMLDVCIYLPRNSLSFNGVYKKDDQFYHFDVDERDGEYIESDTDQAFYQLYELMNVNKNTIPWNKCRFTLFKDGAFDLEFKFDEDLAWYTQLDADSIDFENLDTITIDQIEQWEGLPSNFDRYWLK